MSYSMDADSAGHWTVHGPDTCWACKAIEDATRDKDKPYQYRWVGPDDALTFALENPLPEQVGWLPNLTAAHSDDD